MDEGRRARAGWSAVAVSSLGLATGPSAIFMLSFGALVPALHQAFGWTPARIAIGSSITSLMLVLVSPIQGWLVDRFGARRVILASLPCWAGTLMLFYLLPPRIELFYLLCAFVPIAALGLWPLSYLSLPTTWFDRGLGLAIGLTNTGIGVGAALVSLFLGYGFAIWGWRIAYPVLGLVVLAVVPLCLVWLRAGPLTPNRGRPDPSVLSLTPREAMRSRAVGVMGIAFFILGLTSGGLLIHQISILIEAGFTQQSAIFIQSLIGVGAIVGRIAVGWLLDIFDPRRVAIGVFAVAALAALVLAGGGSYQAAIAGALLLGLVIGGEFDVLVILIRRYVGLPAFGRIYGLVFAVFQLGGAAGSAGLGLSVVWFGSYVPGLVLCGILLATGAAMMPLMGPPRAPAGWIRRAFRPLRPQPANALDLTERTRGDRADH